MVTPSFFFTGDLFIAFQSKQTVFFPAISWDQQVSLHKRFSARPVLRLNWYCAFRDQEGICVMVLVV